MIATILAISSGTRQIIWELEHEKNTLQLRQSRRILVGDSHAAQLHLAKTTELSINGSSLSLLGFVLENTSIFLDSNKTLIISVWHQNLVHQGPTNFNQKIQFWSALMSLPFEAKTNHIGFSTPNIWRLIGSLALQRSHLNNSGTCFEGTFSPNKAPDPNFKTTVKAKPLDDNITASLHNCPANILFLISPTNPNNYQNKNKLMSVTDQFLTSIPSDEHIAVLDLRTLSFPDSCWRDWHHLNCHGSQTVSTAVESKLSELDWN